MPEAKEINYNTEHIDGWDWENSHVSQSYTSNLGDMKNVNVHDIVESGTVLIAAGPSDMAAASEYSDGVRIVPIGLVESATISMNKPLSRIFEIGSKLSYIIPGRTVGEIALARVFFDGPSLLKVLYMGEVDNDMYNGATQEKLTGFASNKKREQTRTQPIGSGHVAMNLASSFFEQPVGLVFYFRDQENDDVGQIYFEGCRVSTYNMGISANMNVLTETVRMEFTQCVPVVGTISSSIASYGDNEEDFGALPDIPIVGALNSNN